MYTLVKALGVSKLQDSRWKDISIGNVLVEQLFDTYRKIYITLSNIYLANEVTIELESLVLKYSAFQGTFNELLIFIGANTLDTVVIPPVLNPKYVSYTDAFRAGYKINPVSVLSNNPGIPTADKIHLQISRDSPVTDMQSFHDYCLVSVNGFYHQTDFDGIYGYAVEGANSMLKSHQNQIGILSFYNIGKIEKVQIKPEMLFRQDENSEFNKRTYISLNKDLTNKTIVLVLGGYMLFLDGKSFWQVSDKVFGIDISRISFIERYFESLPYLNLTSLGLPVSTNNPTMVDFNELVSDEVLTKYFTLTQSFFCIINTPNLFINKISIKPTGLPGMFIGYKEPKYPLVVANGRVAEYWKTYEDKQWAINVQNSYKRNLVLSTVPETVLNVVSDSAVPSRTFENSGGYLLEIGKDF